MVWVESVQLDTDLTYTCQAFITIGQDGTILDSLSRFVEMIEPNDPYFITKWISANDSFAFVTVLILDVACSTEEESELLAIRQWRAILDAGVPWGDNKALETWLERGTHGERRSHD